MAHVLLILKCFAQGGLLLALAMVHNNVLVYSKLSGCFFQLSTWFSFRQTYFQFQSPLKSVFLLYVSSQRDISLVRCLDDFSFHEVLTECFYVTALRNHINLSLLILTLCVCAFTGSIACISPTISKYHIFNPHVWKEVYKFAIFHAGDIECRPSRQHVLCR